MFLDSDTLTRALLALLFVGNAEAICEIAKLLGRRKELFAGLAHLVYSNLLKVVFSVALLPQRLQISYDSNNALNLTYLFPKVKLKTKKTSISAVL